MPKHSDFDASEFTEVTTFTVTHPFSPFSGRKFPIVKTINKFGMTYLHFISVDGSLHSIRSDWTDYTAMKDCEYSGHGKCLAYYEDLVELNFTLKNILLL